MSAKPIVACFVDDIVAIIDKYKDEGITVAEVIGSFELIKIDLINEQQSDEFDTWME